MSTKASSIKDIGKATAAEIAAWKEAHQEVYAYQSIFENERHWTYCRVPTLSDIDFAMETGGGKGIAMSKALYSTVYLSGSAFAKADDRIKRGIWTKLLALCKPIEAIEVKL